VPILPSAELPPSPIRDAYRTFTDALKEQIDKGLDLERLVHIVVSQLSFVAITLDAQDNPYRIFESLNAKGMPLTQGDLLRNYFAVDPAMITDELVAIRYEASIADGAYGAYRAMFFDPRHAGSELGITEDEVRGITTPALLVHGREDKVVPLSVSVTMLGLLPNADLHVFSHCGHWTQIERADEFSALVSDFLGRS